MAKESGFESRQGNEFWNSDRSQGPPSLPVNE